MKIIKFKTIAILILLIIIFTIISIKFNSLPFLVPLVFAHCDTMGGPVIKSAQKALDTGNVNLVLIWIQKQDEEEIKKAFEKTITVRKLNKEAKELADKYFFETLVRIHRAGEGAPYTGLKPEETINPIILSADKALETGSIEKLIKEINNITQSKLRGLFKQVNEKNKNATKSIEAGREYVKAYIEFTHYVEGLHTTALGQSIHHDDSEKKEIDVQHKH